MCSVCQSCSMPGSLVTLAPLGLSRAVCVGKAVVSGVVRTRVLPRQELGEEGVVVGQRLAGDRWVGGGLAGGGEVGQLGAGLCVLLRDLLGNGTCRKRTWSAI